MSFVVDGAEWRFDGWTAEEVFTALDKLLARVHKARERDEMVWIGEDLQSRPMLGTLDLWSLCSDAAPIRLSVELTQELSAWLAKAPQYLDEKEWPEGFADDNTVRIAENPSEANADVAWAHHHIRAGRAVACLGMKRAGPVKTTTSKGSALVYWVQDENTHRLFWRDAIRIEGDCKETLERLAPHAFPDLYFHDGVWSGMQKLGGGYAASRDRIRHYLSALDDGGRWAFTFPPPALSRGEACGPDSTARPTNQIIERRFQGMDLDMAPENPNVYADRVCREAREILVGGRALYCEWHGKLEGHRNRIHVHPPVPQSNDKVVIGIIHEHLPLPGNG